MPYADHAKRLAVQYRWRKTPAGRQYVRHHYLKTRYGITAAEYEALLAKQNGVCAVCGCRPEAQSSSRFKFLSVDHDHATGHVRGLLCSACNRGLGLLGDTLDRAKALVAYLEVSHR